MTVRDGAIDACMQHPTAEFLALPMFDSLRRWSHGALPQGDLPVSWTIDRMDRAGVGHGMLCAWWGPSGPLIPNEAVGELVLAHPDRFSMVAAVDLHRPMAGVHELHRAPAQPWRGKVLFGSNSPAWPADECLADLRQLGLDTATSSAFLRGNADEAFKLATA